MYFQARIFVTLALVAATFAAFSVQAEAATGDLTYAGCLTGELASGGSGSGACSQITGAARNGSGTGFDSLRAIAISPDGRSAYAISTGDSSVLHLDRDRASGNLSLTGCISADLETSDVCELIGEASFGGQNSGLDFPQDVAVSPDGRHVYVASDDDDAIARFVRDTTTGALTYAGCLSGETESADACALTPDADTEGTNSGLNRLRGLAVSADGKSVYAVSLNDDALARFDRNAASGALSFSGCVSGDTQADGCVQVPQASLGGVGSGVNFPGGVELSPDGRNVYVAATADDAVATFDRGPNGEITFAGAISGAPNTGFDGIRDLAISADGSSVYATSVGDDAVVRFARTEAGRLTLADCITGQSVSAPPCARIDSDTPTGIDSGLDSPRSIEVSADGASVYVSSETDDAVTVFARGEETGALAKTGCITGSGEAARLGCQLTATATEEGGDSGLSGLQGIALSPDGTSLYATTIGDDSIATFAREPKPAPVVPQPELPQAPEAPAGGPAPDTRAPALELSGARVQRSRAIAVTASCDERCNVEVTGAAKRIGLRTARGQIEAGGTAELRLRLDGPRAKRKARSVLGSKGRLRFRLNATATDAAANTSVDTLAVTLKRR